MSLLSAFTGQAQGGPPVGPVSINWGHRLSQGLTGLWAFNDAMYHPGNTAGGPYNSVNDTPAALVASAPANGWTRNAAGPAYSSLPSAISLTGTAAFQSNHMIPADRVTILMIMRLPSATISNGQLSGVGNGGTDVCKFFFPSWPNDLIFDFGGASGSNRLATTATFTTQVYYYAFVAGARGMAIYRNGVKLASQTTAVTRTLGGAFSLARSSDAAEFNFLAFLNAEWLPSQVAEWMADPYAMVRQTSRRRFLPGEVSAGAAFLPKHLPRSTVAVQRASTW